MFRRPLFVLVAVLAVAALGTIVSAEEMEHSCPAAGCSMEKIPTGLRCTMTPKEGVTLAEMREHITKCSAKRFPEGVTTTFEEKDGALVVTHTATDPEVVKKLHEMADAKGEGAGCKHHAEEAGKPGCMHHGEKTAEAGAEGAKPGCQHHAEGAEKAEGQHHAEEAGKPGCMHHGEKTAEAGGEAPKAGCQHHHEGEAAEAEAHSCPAAGCSMEKIPTGLRCTMTPKEGVTLAEMREHITKCSAKCFPQGVTTTFEEKDGALVVTHASTDAEVVKKLHEMADAKGEGAGCKHHEHGDEAAKAGCPNHKNAEAKGCCPKDGKGCCAKHKAA